MGRGVNCGLKERQEQVPQQLSKILQQILLFVDITVCVCVRENVYVVCCKSERV